MAETWLRLAAFLCSICGMAWLALAMPPHWRQVRRTTQQPGRATHTLRTLGATALAASLALALSADHPTIALLVWVMMLTAASILIALTLASRPAWLSWLVAFLRA